MDPHRPARRTSDAERPRTKRRRRDAQPLDSAWLEREALRYVARWESSERGVKDVLEKRLQARCERTGEDPERVLCEIDAVVAGLAAKGYVDDRRFAEQLFGRARKQGQSIARIRARLRSRGIPDPLLEEVEEVDARRVAETHEGMDPDLLAAFETARKRGLGPYCPDTQKRERERDKHLGILARRGFSRDIAHRVIEASLDDAPDDSARR